MAAPKIYYIRHGETDWNAELRFQGRQDIPLNDLGRSQATRNGKRLAGILKDPATFQFISSPLGRARETMHLIRAELGLPAEGYQIDPRLIEVSYGDLEGTTQPELKAADRERYYYRKKNAWTFRPIGGESHEDVVGRITDWLADLNQDCVVTAHGAIGRVLRYHLLGLAPMEAAKFPFPQDRICVLQDGKEEFV